MEEAVPLITIEQAVAAVRSFLDRSKGKQVYPSAPYWVGRIVDAIRALPPAEPTELDVCRVGDAIAWKMRDVRATPLDLARAAIAALKQPGGKER
jgi:hypothetical protein